jgi:hypothetical protein
MSYKVSAHTIESIVGVPRHATDHYGRAVSWEQVVYILHSQDCLVIEEDLRDCDYSLALDLGIDVDDWVQDAPVVLEIRNGRLVPKGTTHLLGVGEADDE